MNTEFLKALGINLTDIAFLPDSHKVEISLGNLRQIALVEQPNAANNNSNNTQFAASNPKDDDWMSVADAAKSIHVDPIRIYKAIEKNKLQIKSGCGPSQRERRLVSLSAVSELFSIAPNQTDSAAINSEWLTRRQAVEAFNISQDTLRCLINQNKVETKVGTSTKKTGPRNVTLVSKSSLKKLVNGETTIQTTQTDVAQNISGKTEQPQSSDNEWVPVSAATALLNRSKTVIHKHLRKGDFPWRWDLRINGKKEYRCKMIHLPKAMEFFAKVDAELVAATVKPVKVVANINNKIEKKDEPEWLTVPEAAKILNKPTKVVLEFCYDNRLHYKKRPRPNDVGLQYMISRESVQKMLAESETLKRKPSHKVSTTLSMAA